MATASITPQVHVNGQVHLPRWVHDHETYRAWARTDDYPETGTISFLDGDIWIDLTMEEFFSHNQVKTAITIALGYFVKHQKLGYFCADRMLWSNESAKLSTEPDAMFIAWDSLKSQRIRLVEGARSNFIELEGSPDMVLEVLSDSSVRKDTLVLKGLYALAGVREYWIVDARGVEPRFEMFQLDGEQFTMVQPNEGWLHSAVFGKSMRLQKVTDPLGNPEVNLLFRDETNI